MKLAASNVDVLDGAVVGDAVVVEFVSVPFRVGVTGVVEITVVALVVAFVLLVVTGFTVEATGGSVQFALTQLAVWFS